MHRCQRQTCPHLPVCPHLFRCHQEALRCLLCPAVNPCLHPFQPLYLRPCLPHHSRRPHCQRLRFPQRQLLPTIQKQPYQASQRRRDTTSCGRSGPRNPSSKSTVTSTELATKKPVPCSIGTPTGSAMLSTEKSSLAEGCARRQSCRSSRCPRG